MYKKLKNYLNIGLIFVYVKGANLLGASNIADGVTEKVDEANEMLGNEVAVSVLTLTLIIIGFGLWFNKFSKETAIKAFAGGLTVSMASAISEFVLG